MLNLGSLQAETEEAVIRVEVAPTDLRCARERSPGQTVLDLRIERLRALSAQLEQAPSSSKTLGASLPGLRPFQAEMA